MILNDTNFQETLLLLLFRSGEQQKVIAEKSGVHVNTIRSWIKGRTYPSLPQLCWVLAAMGKRLEVHDIEDRD